MTDCIFCKIVTGELKPEKIYEDGDVLAFKDTNPQAPVHVLIIPKRHIATLNDLEEGDEQLMGKLYFAAKTVATEMGVSESGYRTLINCNAEAGQSVYHIHMHVLGGRAMGWPPG